jgi:hypothetical protein
MSDFNTPSVIPFFKKKSGGFDLYFKTAIKRALYYVTVKATVLYSL